MGLTISCADLTKRFGDTQALDGLHLEAYSGEIHGFLGPNGAGKSVTMRILLGLVRRSGGSAEIFGHDVWSQAVELHHRIAYVPGETTLWPTLTGGEILAMLARLRAVDRHRGIDPPQLRRLVEDFDLDLTMKARDYSTGNRQKVALVAALASDAEVLILDEPTSGLDPLMEAVFAHHVTAARDEGRTILLSSHLLAEVEKLCDRVTIIREGRTVRSGSLTEMRELQRLHFTVRVSRDPGALTQLPGVHDLAVRNGDVRFEVEHDHLDAVLRVLATLGPTAMACHPPTLEELFLREYGAVSSGTGHIDEQSPAR